MVQGRNDDAVENNKEDDNIENDNDEEEKDFDKIEARLQSMLDSAMKSTEMIGKMSEESQKAYVKRLFSFSPLAYFGKPSCLSPLVCARLGWRNAEKDLLVCSSCHAALAIALHPGLSPDSKEKICNVYREKLATYHKSNCPFKVEGKEFLLNHQKEEEEEGIPSYIVDVFPRKSVELVEHPRPSTLLQSRAKQLEERCPAGYKFPKLEVPESERKQVDSPHISLAAQLKTNESAAMLALLGWEPIVEENKKPTDVESPLPLILGCRFCYSRMELTLEKELEQEQQVEQEEATTKSPPAKKAKLSSRHSAPLDAHRHYCPLVCGFPTRFFGPKKAMWKAIVSRLHQEAEEVANIPPPTGEETKMTEEDFNQTVYRINDILDAAIAPLNPRLKAFEDI
ncbi:unnamed protein product [Cylindrotheca closterium]|uniref:C3HC-type domain-containing protein n=1 Tax=Cylindrotheca closterium TaxID=2856 RepID=A0AAD2CDZ9_9STRA|nr:unnamed protein product [Cylindrotheca closterium]